MESSGTASTILEPLRARLLKVLLSVSLFAAFPALATGLYASLVGGVYFIMLADVVAYLALIAAFILLSHRYTYSATIFVYSVTALGIILLFFVGTEGASVLWLGAAVFMATLFLNDRHVIAVFSLTGIALTATTILLFRDALPWSIPIHGWLAVIGSYLGIVVFLSAGVRFLLNRLSDAIMREQSLNREIQHRVRNNLQLVESFLAIESGGVKQSETTITLQLMMDRVSAIAHSFDSIKRSEADLVVDTRALLEAISVDQEQRGRPPVTIRLTHLPEHLSLDVAIPLAVVIAELLYHFNKPATQLLLETVRKEKTLSMEVRNGLSPGKTSKTTAFNVPNLQEEILHALVSQFGGTLSFRPEDCGPNCLAKVTLPVTMTAA